MKHRDFSFILSSVKYTIFSFNSILEKVFSLGAQEESLSEIVEMPLNMINPNKLNVPKSIIGYIRIKVEKPIFSV